MTTKLNPYSAIRKVPLNYEGINSSAFAVQTEDYVPIGKDLDGNVEYGYKWKEKGVVGENYLLVPNSDVKEMAERIARKSNLNWKEGKQFFNGRQFMYTMTTEDIVGTVTKGDDIGLGFAMWNSYDGSKSLSFEIFLNRLICLNGMVSRKEFMNYRFRHQPQSQDWQNDLGEVISILENIPMEDYMSNFRNLLEPLDIDKLADIRVNHIPKLSTSTFGKTLDNFLVDNDMYKQRGWDFLNSATNILWHNKKQTSADFNNNAYVVEGMLNYAKTHGNIVPN